jgi:histidine triad (HIT) family protein
MGDGANPQPACPFCAFDRRGNEPAGGYVYWDDVDEVMAFEPLKPHTPGHTLVCPIRHYESVLDAPGHVVREVMLEAQRLALRMVENGADGVNIITSAGEAATQTVMHWHVHLIPRYAGDRLAGWPWKPPSSNTPLPPGGINIHMSASPPGPGPGLIAEAFAAGRLHERRYGPR